MSVPSLTAEAMKAVVPAISAQPPSEKRTTPCASGVRSKTGGRKPVKSASAETWDGAPGGVGETRRKEVRGPHGTTAGLDPAGQRCVETRSHEHRGHRLLPQPRRREGAVRIEHPARVPR
ncbi:hypothetical protein GCM10010243_65350 [Streptomyces matensis]|nr:hypothetical protein GCM10010243_65350 [Streptomyces matensis]